MKRIPLLLCLFCCTCLSLEAQVDSVASEYNLPDVVLQANRLQLRFSDVSRSVQVLTRRQLRSLPAQTVNEVLTYVAGVDVRQRGVNGVQADVGIRGGTFDQTLVLINGIKLSDPQTGHHIMNLPIDLESVERIEILKGPGARIYGQNAFSGAINIITKSPEMPFFRLGARAGTYGLGGGRAAVSYPVGDYRQFLSVSKDFSQGYRFNTDYDITNYFYQGQLDLPGQSLEVLAGFTDRKFGANGFYASPDFQDQYEEVQTSLVSVTAQQSWGSWQVQPRLYWRRNQDEYIFVRNNPSIFRNLHIGNTLGAELNASRDNKLGTAGLGIEFNQVFLSSNNLGSHRRSVVSIFAEHRFQLLEGLLDITPGLLYNYYSDFGSNVFPGVDAGLRLGDYWKVYGNIGYTYRVPTFTDLYYEDRVNIGNPDLQPEEAISYEGGIKYTRKGLQVQAAYFQRNGIDNIDWIRASDTLPWQPTNINDLTTRGFELTTNAYLPLVLGYDQPLQHFWLGYTYIDASIEANDAPLSRYALENLDHQVTGGLSYRIGGHLIHTITGRFVSRVNLSDYTVIDTKLQLRLPKLTFYTELTNVTDTDYLETNLVPMPGRWLRGGVQLRL